MSRGECLAMSVWKKPGWRRSKELPVDSYDMLDPRLDIGALMKAATPEQSDEQKAREISFRIRSIWKSGALCSWRDGGANAGPRVPCRTRRSGPPGTFGAGQEWSFREGK